MGFERPELSLVITGDLEIQSLNQQWRGKDKPTDVLSFSQVESGDFPFPDMEPLAPEVLGDIVISADTAAAQATKGEYSLEAEYRRLMVHGVLHLLGHDHVHGGRQAAKMTREEQRLLELLDVELGVV